MTTEPDTTPILSDAHRHMLIDGSHITPEYVTQRGYQTFTKPADLKSRQFSGTQSKMVPCLGIPLWTVTGEQHGWQARPDAPRLDKKGKVIKYETPYKAKLTLDCHPFAQPMIGDPSVLLWITEGVKKGDALASQGCCAIAFPGGVWGFRSTNEAGGKVLCPDWGHVALNGRDVYIVYDNDVVRKAEVGKALAALTQFLRSKDAKPHTVLLPDTGTKLGVDDWLAQGHMIEELMGFVGESVVEQIQAPRNPHLPTIDQEKDKLDLVIDQAEAALMVMPGAPLVFQRARRLVAIAPPEKQAPYIDRDASAAIISTITLPRLRKLLAKAANWYTPNRRTRKMEPDMPVHWVVETLLDQEDWQFPPLTGIAHTPTLRPDGSLIYNAGYDTDTGLWLTWQKDINFPSIPPHPTHEDACAALDVLNEPFIDFPFAEEWHRASAVAAVLSLIARYTFRNVPLFAIRATTRASGKGLLADCISLIATGRTAAKMPQVHEEEEERKRILSIALDGDPLVVIDNVSGPLGNAALDLAITSSSFKDRLLGKNATKEAPLHTMFIATGNNMFFRGDLTRRVLPIDLAPLMEHPETRSDFVHGNGDLYLDWLKKARATFVVAALTILRAYFEAGCPLQPFDQQGHELLPWGSFDLWCNVIRMALVWCGTPDPCLGRIGLEAMSDDLFEAHTELLAAWYACYERDGAVPAKSLVEIIGDLQFKTSPPGHAPEQRTIDMEKHDRLRNALGAFDDKFDGSRLNALRLGNSIKKLTGRVIDGKRLKKLDVRSKYGIQWTIERIDIGVAGVASVTNRQSNARVQKKVDFIENTENTENTDIHTWTHVKLLENATLATPATPEHLQVVNGTAGHACPQCDSHKTILVTDGYSCLTCFARW